MCPVLKVESVWQLLKQKWNKTEEGQNAQLFVKLSVLSGLSNYDYIDFNCIKGSFQESLYNTYTYPLIKMYYFILNYNKNSFLWIEQTERDGAFILNSEIF